MRQAVLEIVSGLNFLLEQAIKMKATMDTGAEHDVFYASITDGHITSEHICDIQGQMILLGWSRNGNELLSFRHYT